MRNVIEGRIIVVVGGTLMRKRPILSALVVVAAAYTAYPYVALYRLQAALQSGDPARLSAMVDWDRVRQGLKDDIAEELLAEPPEPAEQPKAITQNAAAVLPPFGASFVKGIASTAVDLAVTPDSIARIARPGREADMDDADPDPLKAISFKHAHVTWAFFQNPETFMLWLRTSAGGAVPVKLRMELHDGTWKITRVWLPPDLLRRRG